MVAGKQQQHASTATSNSNNSAYEIRSGMSVQDLKQLTAQRAHRQRMEYWDLHASTSSTRNSSPRPTASSEWAFGSPVSSTSSSPSSSLSDSPPRQYSKNNMYAYPNSYANQSHSSSSSSSYHHSHNSYHSHMRGSPSTLSSSGNDKMFVTCGGQVVSFMEGVVNAPQFEFLPKMLNTL